MIHLFAPVPAVHIPDTIATHAAQGVVAFGSSQFELLNGLKDKPVTVCIGASTGYVPEGGVPGVSIGKVMFRGRLHAADWCDARGRPPVPDWRPASTMSDGVWTMFYAVTDLVALDPPLASANLKRKGGGRIDMSPHMLTLIEAPAGA